jgi:hypothetical protein
LKPDFGDGRGWDIWWSCPPCCPQARCVSLKQCSEQRDQWHGSRTRIDMRIIRDVRWQQSLEVDYAGQDRNCLLGGHYYRAGTVRGWLGWKHGARLSTITIHDEMSTAENSAAQALRGEETRSRLQRQHPLALPSCVWDSVLEALPASQDHIRDSQPKSTTSTSIS